jgi:hypothetical protein
MADNRSDWRGGAANMGIAMQPALMAAALIWASASHAQTTPDPLTFPELQQQAMLPQIVDEMRRTLRDPGSVNDLTMCAPVKIKMKNGQPVRWTVMLSFNAKNAYGGYVGLTYYGAIFYAGKRPNLTEIMAANAEGLDSLISRAIEKQMAGCPRIPNANLQRLPSN